MVALIHLRIVSMREQENRRMKEWKRTLKRLVIQCWAIAACLSCLFGVRAGQPNIVVIMADDLGWMDLHVQGNKRLDTPSLDKLASEGMRFTDGYAAAPVCSPTRAAMMTGLTPARLKITNHAPGHPDGFVPKGKTVGEAPSVRHLDLGYETIAERLKAAGYSTGFVGKWHLSHRPRNAGDGPTELELRPEHQGFDLNVGGCSRGGPPSYFAPYNIPAIEGLEEGEYLPERLADECIDFVRRNRERPFFLSWWNYSVHYPFQAPKALIEKYESRKGPGNENPTYSAMIEGMDRSIGRFLDRLDELQLASNTLVIFKSDNGSFGVDVAPLRGQKGYLFEGGIRVPWIVRWPGVVEAGSICSEPVISTDVYPTLLEVAGLKPKKRLDGESLLPLLRGQGTLMRDAVYFHYPNYAFHKDNRLGSAIREGDYKLIRRYDDGSLELYNLEQDLGERANLTGQLPQLARRLDAKLSHWLKDVGAQMPVRK